MSVSRASLDLSGALEELERDLGPGRGDRLIFLPPLVATLSGLGPNQLEQGLDAAVAAVTRGRRGRRWGVWFAYPRAGRQRRRWLVNHDRVHEALRGPIAALARALGCTVVGGTALLDHPRTHWEAWPHTGCLFHTAWSFGPDGEPFDVLRDGAPGWPVLDSACVDSSRAGASGLLQTPLGPVAVDWGEGAPPEGSLVWRPLAGAEVDDEDAQLVSDRRPYVVSSLHGSLGEALVDDTVILVRSGFTPIEARPPGEALECGLGWCAAETGAQL